MINQKEKLESTCTHQFVRTLPHPGNPSAPRRTKRCSTDGRSLSCVHVCKCTSVQVVCKCTSGVKVYILVEYKCIRMLSTGQVEQHAVPNTAALTLEQFANFPFPRGPAAQQKRSLRKDSTFANLQKPVKSIRSTARNDCSFLGRNNTSPAGVQDCWTSGTSPKSRFRQRRWRAGMDAVIQPKVDKRTKIESTRSELLGDDPKGRRAQLRDALEPGFSGSSPGNRNMLTFPCVFTPSLSQHGEARNVTVSAPADDNWRGTRG